MIFEPKSNFLNFPNDQLNIIKFQQFDKLKIYFDNLENLNIKRRGSIYKNILIFFIFSLLSYIN